MLVVGGGNSAGQAAVHLANHAKQVTILVRSDSLAASMSNYQIRKIDNVENITVRFRSEVVAVHGEGWLEQVTLARRGSPERETVRAEAMFLFVGAEPHTGWLPSEVARDRWGFVPHGEGGERKLPRGIGPGAPPFRDQRARDLRRRRREARIGEALRGRRGGGLDGHPLDPRVPGRAVIRAQLRLLGAETGREEPSSRATSRARGNEWHPAEAAC